MGLTSLEEINKLLSNEEKNLFCQKEKRRKKLATQNYHTRLEITRIDLSVFGFGPLALSVPKGHISVHQF